MTAISTPMSQAYLEQMEAHIDAGGQLSHANAVDLFHEIMRLRAVLVEARAALHNATDGDAYCEFDDTFKRIDAAISRASGATS